MSSLPNYPGDEGGRGSDRLAAPRPADIPEEILAGVLEMGAASLLALEGMITAMTDRANDDPESEQELLAAIALVRSVVNRTSGQLGNRNPSGQLAQGFVTRGGRRAQPRP